MGSVGFGVDVTEQIDGDPGGADPVVGVGGTNPVEDLYSRPPTTRPSTGSRNPHESSRELGRFRMESGTGFE